MRAANSSEILPNEKPARQRTHETLRFAGDARFLIYVLDASIVGNSNVGHDFGADLSDAEKRALIEHLKTR